MIKSLTVTNYLGEKLTLDLANPYTSGLAIEYINGLGPGEATINMTEIATNDGSLYNSARLPSREITIGLRFLWDPTIEDARHKTYKYFPIKKKVTLRFVTDTRTLEIDGYVQSNEPDIFSKKEGCTISILCEDPYFYSTYGGGSGSVTFYGVTPLFEFAFENDSLTTPLLEFGNIENKSENLVAYDGDVEIGIIIKIHSLGNASGITIYNAGTREVMNIDSTKLVELTGSDIIAGDTITINTTRGHKSIYLSRGGTDINILNCLDRDSDWFQLVKGDNIFAFSAAEGETNLQFRLDYKSAYEGV